MNIAAIIHWLSTLFVLKTQKPLRHIIARKAFPSIYPCGSTNQRPTPWLPPHVSLIIYCAPFWIKSKVPVRSKPEALRTAIPREVLRLFISFRVREVIASQSSRPDLRQIGSIWGSATAGVARPTLRIVRVKIGPRWPEGGMRKWEVIISRALSFWLQPPFCSAEKVYNIR